MKEFEKRYTALNSAQKQAVDAIDGPVLVVAGPGTGKTELLSVRVANILQRTDALASNILCLTFTDSGAAAMRERLVSLLGPDAYKVAVHTFHSFGSEIIHQNAEYFYSGARFRPADDLARYEVLNQLLEKLPHSNPLSSQLNGQFTYLRDIQTAISELKRGGYSPDEFGQILAKNAAFTSWLQPKLNTVFSSPISKKTLPLAGELALDISSFSDTPLELAGYHALSEVIQQTLQSAVESAIVEQSTKPLTAWKNHYLEKDAHAQWTLKDEKRGLKGDALRQVYNDYLKAMRGAELYDYDDMILQVIHALETNDDLRFNLQEQFQYLLVDEFQDTNDAQMRLVWNLTNNPVSEGRPNLLVVGDDDQAIYRFQGAQLSNILDFTSRYKNVEVITLTDNYRSVAPILELSRSVITQAQERLETVLENVSKALTAHHLATGQSLQATSYETSLQAKVSLVAAIAADIQKYPKKTRAVIGRHHRELTELLPHFAAHGIAVHYEHQHNVLETDPIEQLEAVAHTMWHLATQEFDAANQHIAELLAHPAWSLDPLDIWQLSLDAHRTKRYWLEVMLEKGGALKEIAEWLIVGSAKSKTEPLEYMLDYIFGIDQPADEFSAPYRNYYFGGDIDTTYLAYLHALQKIRSSLREYRPDHQLKLEDFIQYLDLHRELNLSLNAHADIGTDTNAVTLLSAHKAKGLEFDSVYLTDAVESVWGSSARSRGRLISFPSNLPLSPAGDSDDERLRLLFVALTRAKNELLLFASHTNEQGKALQPVGALAELAFTSAAPAATPVLTTALETDWSQRLAAVSPTDQRQLLQPDLKNYKLSATHLNNFLDTARGGPRYFLLHNFLHLPAAMSPSAVYGSVVHAVLQHTHQHLSATGKKRPLEDVLHDFESLLSASQLSELDHTNYLDRGVRTLTAFLDQRYSSFSPTQKSEQTFSHEHIVVGDTVIAAKGNIDLLQIDTDEKTIFVTDYKTGKAAHSWQGRDEHEKKKLHGYEHQLMFYKLLIESSRQFAGYTVTGARLEFVEPDPRGEVVLLDYVYSTEKLAEFKKLLVGVWRRIQSLDFSLSGDYNPSLKGSLAFEADLREI